MKKQSLIDKLYLQREIQHKLNEFQALGYHGITAEDLWCYLYDYRWHKHPVAKLAQKRAEVKELKPNDFFDYQNLLIQTSKERLDDWRDLSDFF